MDHFVFVFLVRCVFLSVYCSPVVTCWERVDLLALLCVMFYCVFVTFPCGVIDYAWCLMASISDLYLLYIRPRERLMYSCRYTSQ